MRIDTHNSDIDTSELLHPCTPARNHTLDT